MSHLQCRDEETMYERLAKIGQGTYGEVYRAREKKTGQIVALKKIKMANEEDGFPVTAIREIKLLQQLKCENIVKLIEVCSSTQRKKPEKIHFSLVFEFCEHDLSGILNNKDIQLSAAENKSIMKQLLEGLFIIHHHRVMHRDLKPPNILITKNGVVKLADFGLARQLKPISKAEDTYTNYVVTLWYRPPELLLGEKNYGPAIDMWGAGCIFAELFTKSALLKGRTEQNQLYLISRLCGSITPEVWPEVVNQPLYNKFELPSIFSSTIRQLGGVIKDPMAISLLSDLLQIDPTKRLSAEDALDHEYFFNDPLATDLKETFSKIKSTNTELLVQNRRIKVAQRRLPLQPAPPRATAMDNSAPTVFDRVF